MSNISCDDSIYGASSNMSDGSHQPMMIKKRRNLPGTPDPSADVIALSPKTLMATNRFICEICNKGFQRDQNLQLHRRGHNLPWKLRQRSPGDDVRKRVYVCPEPTCVHHDPTRALGDLTGIKKHFSRKHGEKKWKCEKCSKKYAVKSDWKAHLKTCGSKEYICDCGSIFSRRDSFITHRAFCDALSIQNTNTNHQNLFTSPCHLPRVEPSPPPPPPPPAAFFDDIHCHMSATTLLQKAVQMGATSNGDMDDPMAPEGFVTNLAQSSFNTVSEPSFSSYGQIPLQNDPLKETQIIDKFEHQETMTSQLVEDMEMYTKLLDQDNGIISGRISSMTVDFLGMGRQHGGGATLEKKPMWNI